MARKLLTHNMGSFDRAVRAFVMAPVAIGIAFGLGASSIAGIALLALAGIALVTGATGVFVIPAVPYLQALGLERDELVQALGLSFTVSTVALTAGLVWQGAFEGDNLLFSGLAIAPALAGMWAGQVVRNRVDPPVFRRWFLISLLVLGAEMLARPLL